MTDSKRSQRCKRASKAALLQTAFKGNTSAAAAAAIKHVFGANRRLRFQLMDASLLPLMGMSAALARTQAGAQSLADSRRFRRPGEAAGALGGLDRLTSPALPVTNCSRHPVGKPNHDDSAELGFHPMGVVSAERPAGPVTRESTEMLMVNSTYF